ncbi:SAM pointed domain-containing Ets transcription factor [Salarias fasciatus]|uniref:SAM pointed domain-containing Ets transcription factor n=1 Tax=Salarias fasciatus TaxID=181472 RepID=UPI001176C8A2|nr:SAM pointed domain-containing Ets transcription factor [Salarias fasciatus]
MGSADGERVGRTAQTSLYVSHFHSRSSMAWLEEAEDWKTPGAVFSDLNWPGACIPSSDKENPWVLRKTEQPASPPSRTPEQRLAAPWAAQHPLPEAEGPVEEHCLEQVQTMVVEEVLRDVNTACKLLSIPPDPLDWSCVQVQKWLLWTEHQYRLPQTSALFQEMCGRDLCFLTEADFKQRCSQFGGTLFAHLDIWRSVFDEAPWLDVKSNYPNQPIQLWQFLRELLLKPHSYSRCIRWLNKDKGIFKIEDSAHVARLWGIRKNRPAMNYDKLSRSIRQYYKKGIIRKPEVSGRLIYQFVIPV